MTDIIKHHFNDFLRLKTVIFSKNIVIFTKNVNILPLNDKKGSFKGNFRVFKTSDVDKMMISKGLYS